MTQVGKTVLMLLGLLGGLAAILMGSGIVLYSVISAASSHIPREWIGGSLLSPEIGGLLYIVLGSMGVLGALLIYTRYLRVSAALLLASGILGFLVSYACSSRIMGVLNWIAPGILLILAGILTLITPEKLGSSLPLLKSDRQIVRRVGYAVFGILLLYILWTTLMFGILSFLGTLTFSVPDHETNTEDALTEGSVAESMGALEGAIGAYDRAIALNASCVEAWYKKGIDLGSLGHYEEAIKCYDKVIKLNKSFTDAYPHINVLSLKGGALLALNRTDEASLCYEQAVELNPKDEASWTARGSFLYKQGKHTEALQCYDTVIELDPDDKEAWTSRCDIIDKQGNYDELLKCYDKLIELDQKYYESPRDYAYRWTEKGNVLFNQSKYNEAIRCYDNAIQIYPGGEAQRKKEEAILALFKTNISNGARRQ